MHDASIRVSSGASTVPPLAQVSVAYMHVIKL